jgi:subtilase family serine protease
VSSNVFLFADFPDLKVRQFLFVPGNDKSLRVQVANFGKKVSTQCRLELTVRKINGAAVGRKMEVVLPAIQPGQTDWINIDASGILPKNVSLKDTTFKLIADSTKSVAESNETNNEVWHNLN